ncbi:hypothetical protein N7460_012073 [Penicillium canescens]|uniref:Uncharacterized protein n=1 Tax=Penicillium canescens TaxID=5083 RepID=A0AAD6I1S0_PENCN|nr:hypothetical protein N7460_012073 [Penicillium canescens]KAJ6040540.1 hypothetical protein N7444_009445 [Penicillium canescens]
MSIFTPPESPRKRRKHQRESRETDGDMKIGQYIYRSDPYRTTSVENPSPYPFSVVPLAPQEEDRTLPLHPVIPQILQSHGFSTVSFACMHGSTFDNAGAQVTTDLLRVVLTTEDSMPDSIGAVKDHLVRLLQQHRIQNVHVEILNIDLCHKPSLAYLPLDNPLAMAYEKTKVTVANLLRREIPGRWHLVCAFDISSRAEKQRPAVVVIVSPNTSANWFGLRGNIAAILAPHVSEIEIEFLPGDIQPLAYKEVSVLDRMKVEGDPGIGSSIGIHGDNNSGTLGGFVVLTANGTSHKGFLTNYHVVRPKTPKDFVTDLDRLGCSLGSKQGQHIQMEYPSHVDHNYTLGDLHRRLSNLRSQQWRQGSMSPVVAQQFVAQAQRSEATLTQKGQILHRLPAVLGDVFITSGKAIENRHVQDWAFVKMPPESSFFGLNLMFKIPPHLTPDKYLPHATSTTIEEDTVLSSINKLIPGAFCTKIGRTTGVTAGVCNGAKAICQWAKGDEIRWDLSGNTAKVTSSSADEFVVVNGKLRGSDSQQSTFCDAGDSGSFVLDEYGNLNGLLYGGVFLYVGTNAQECFGGLTTSMDDVIESIRRRNGDQVTLSLSA